MSEPPETPRGPQRRRSLVVGSTAPWIVAYFGAATALQLSGVAESDAARARVEAALDGALEARLSQLGAYWPRTEAADAPTGPAELPPPLPDGEAFQLVLRTSTTGTWVVVAEENAPEPLPTQPKRLSILATAPSGSWQLTACPVDRAAPPAVASGACLVRPVPWPSPTPSAAASAHRAVWIQGTRLFSGALRTPGLIGLAARREDASAPPISILPTRTAPAAIRTEMTLKALPAVRFEVAIERPLAAAWSTKVWLGGLAALAWSLGSLRRDRRRQTADRTPLHAGRAGPSPERGPAATPQSGRAPTRPFDVEEQVARLSAWRAATRHVVHELKNPMFPIKLSLESIQRKARRGQLVLPPDAEAPIATALEELGRMELVTQNFARFLRMPELSRGPTDLGALVTRVIATYRHLERPTIAWSPPARPIIAHVDPDRTEALLRHLIGNALELDPPAQHLEVTLMAMPGDDFVTLSIEDDGPGLTQAELELAFTPDFSSKTFGTGLGLPSVERIVAAHEGRLRAYSSKGQGTRFVVQLPRQTASGPAPELDA